MQNERYSVRNRPIPLPAAFPVDHFVHTQRFSSSKDLHAHDCVELGLCLEGSGVFFIGDHVYPFQKGDVSCILAGHPHIAQSPNDCPSRWWFCSLSPIAFAEAAAIPDSLLTADEDSVTLMRLLYHALTGGRVGRPTIDHLLRACLAYLGQQAPPRDVFRGAADSAPIMPAIQYITQHYADVVDIPVLAAVCHFSVGHFRTVFKECVGISPMAYLTKVRMLAAADLLRRTEKPIAAVAAESGYASLSSFNRQFKDHYGQSPRDFRRQKADRGI